MNTKCVYPTCKKDQYKNGYCKVHNRRFEKYGTVDCAVENCDGIYYASGMCKKHSTKYYRYGDTKGIYNQPIQDRFWKHVQKTDTCWIWTGNGNTSGKPYGRFRIDSKTRVLAHCFSYETIHGRIDDTLQIDHLCENKRCVNPDHLIAVSAKIHKSRHAQNEKMCRNGHRRTEQNTYTDKNGWYRCKICEIQRIVKHSKESSK